MEDAKEIRIGRKDSLQERLRFGARSLFIQLRTLDLLEGSASGSLTKGRVPHISLVFREMWDTTALSL